MYEKIKDKQWSNCKSGYDKSGAQAELQSNLLADINSVTGWEIAGK